jgi:hypothetical protein
VGTAGERQQQVDRDRPRAALTVRLELGAQQGRRHDPDLPEPARLGDGHRQTRAREAAAKARADYRPLEFRKVHSAQSSG